MVLNRLKWVAGDLHKNIFAYTNRRGTKDCITEMMHTITNRKAIVTFMDLEKAFETANATAILDSLSVRGVGGKLLRWTADFLEERRARVKFQGVLSETRTFENGTPQGSILSPFLFNILIENIAALNITDTKILAYADDIAIISTGRRYERRAREAATVVADMCQKLGLKINAQKTRSMHFGSRKILPPVILDNTPVEWSSCHTYLGICLDAKLNFRAYTESLKERANARIRVMRKITGTNGGAAPEILRLYYLQAIRSVIEYGAPCLALTSSYNLYALETLQNKALRIITGAPRWTKVCTLQQETKIPPLTTRLYATNASHLVKFFRQHNNEPLYQIRQALAQDRTLFHKSTWAATTSDTLKFMEAQKFFTHLQLDKPHKDYIEPPPWNTKDFQTSVTALPHSKKDLDQETLQAAARIALQAAPPHNCEVYYTDGSVDPITKRAAAAFVSENTTAIFRLTDGASTLQTELVAIQQALRHCKIRHKHIVIHTDSLGAIQALQQTPIKDNIELITSILATMQNIKRQGRNIHINWVPSHAGLEGNEAADKAANDAIKLPTVTFHIQTSIQQTKNALKHKTNDLMIQILQNSEIEGSNSSRWYNQTSQNKTNFPRNLKRKTQVDIYRLRLGYKCFDQIKNTLPQTCSHCGMESDSPLQHYLTECEITAPLIDRRLGTAQQIVRDTPHDKLASLVEQFPPPR
ncbi:uncharacterized protein LOC123503805 [Portunus trituberculatus]|uniref:uncharacterized protein LOC123503805 n=1 Tax=Portunus trituberculatus TaxID=210409 RepID=UPI001E1CCEE4|nr:uncharacterized protein LOC123503805 [Portunus trituberculatus]